jgi:hypothetical protein
MLAMSHSIPADGFMAEARRIPIELRIPVPPWGRRLATHPAEPRWRQALRWSLMGLTASWVAGEVTLLLLGL